MRKSLLLLPAALGALLLAGCSSSRNVHYTLTKTYVSQNQVFADQKELNGTSGVDKVITNVSSGNVVTLDLYLIESNPQPGLETASGLGYQLVKN